MARIISVGTSVPAQKVSQKEAKAFVAQMYQKDFPNIDDYLTIFDNTAIDERYFAKPKEWFMQERSFCEKNSVFVEEACHLAQESITNCLREVNVSAKEVDAIFFVSTTGFATPSVETYIIQNLHMNPQIKRTPIWGLGCAGGAAGLARAYEAAKAYPKGYVLLVAVELCSLTFCKNDISISNFVATSLFSDGAAAVLIAGDEVENQDRKNMPRIISAMSMCWPYTQDVMGWEFNDQGLKVIFSKEIPNLIREKLQKALVPFLSQNQLQLDQVEHLIFHPGGQKVIQAYKDSLKISGDKLEKTSSVLRSYGNMSSPTVLFVLQEHVKNEWKRDDYGLMLALGPGFSLEALLLHLE